MVLVSKFQHRLVGTIIMVALSIIVLPNMLDGKKKYYKEEALAIPLALKLKDRPGINLIPTLTHMPKKHTDNSSQDNTSSILLQSHNQPMVVVPLLVQQQKKSKLVEKIQIKKNNSKGETALTNQMYVVQLCALKNASKVNEILAKLRLSDYHVFTVPARPLQGQVTRIYIGPDESKKRMQVSVDQLQSLSGLKGVVMPYHNTR